MRWIIALLLVIAGCSAQEQEEAVSTPAEDADLDDADGIGSGDEAVGINPRWVLYDGDGEAVEALIEPVSRNKEEDLPIQSLDVYDCFTVTMVGDTYWNRATYSVENGRMEDCYDFSRKHTKFVDEECTEPLAVSRHSIQVVDGVLSIATEPYDTELRYSLSTAGDCIESSRTTRSWRYTPVPSEMLNEFNNPPYELKVAY